MTNTFKTTEVPNLVPNIIFDDDRDVQHVSYIDGGDTRQSTVEHLPVSQRRYGPHDSKRLQRTAVDYIKECCGSDLYRYYDGANHKFSLEPILEQTKRDIAPTASTRQIRRWFRYSVENGQTKADEDVKKKLKHDYRRRVVYRLDKNKKKEDGQDMRRDI